MRVCSCKNNELGSENNLIVISDLESLGLSSNSIIIHCDEYNFSIDRLSAQSSFNADTEIIYIQEFWNSVINNIDSDLSNKNLETDFCVLYSDFNEFSINDLLFSRQLLDRDKKNTIISILYNSTINKYYTKKQILSDIIDIVSASQIIFSICSSSEQNQTTI